MRSKICNPLILILSFLFILTSIAQARMGKVFFTNGRWLKGDVQVQKDPEGNEEVAIALHSGSVTVSKTEVTNIVYSSPSENAAGALAVSGFQRAFEVTPSKPAVEKSPGLYEHYIRHASQKHRLDPELVKAVIKQESNFNRNDVSQKGAQGLMQLMPETARKLGVGDTFDPWENIHGGTLYLRMMLEHFNGNLEKALAAYNAGPGAVEKYGAIPPYRETQGYVRNVLNYYRMYRGSRLFAYQKKDGMLIISDQPYVP